MDDNDRKRWREAMRDTATGPLRIAGEVRAKSLEWDPAQHDGLSFSNALTMALGAGHDQSFFLRRANAVDMLGGFRVARMFDHEAAKWLTGKAQNEKLAACVKLCASEFNRKHECPLPVSTVRRVTGQLLGLRPKTRIHHCAECVAKARALEELQAEVEALRAEIGGKSVIASAAERTVQLA